MLFHTFHIEKRTFRGVGLFLQLVINTQLFALTFKFSLEDAVRNVYKVLIILSAKIYFILNTFKVAYHQCSYVVFNTIFGDMVNRSVKKIVNLVSPFSRVACATVCILVPLIVINGLEACFCFIVPLVISFDRTSTNYKRRTIGSVNTGSKIIESTINTKNVFLVKFYRFKVFFIYIFYFIIFPSEFRKDSKFSKLFNSIKVFWKVKYQLFKRRIVKLFKRFSHPDMHLSILYSSRATLNRQKTNSFFILVIRHIYFLTILTLLFEFQKSKEGFKITINNTKNLLRTVRKKKFIIFIGLALMVIKVVRKVTVVIKIILTNRIKPYIVKSSRMVTKFFNNVTLLFTWTQYVFLSEKHLYKANIRNKNKLFNLGTAKPIIFPPTFEKVGFQIINIS